MSEKMSVEAQAVMNLTSRENATYVDVLGAVLRMEAAAEERGRRAGIEERGELRTLLAEARPHLGLAFYSPPSAQRKANALLDRIDAALAPRDSGKEG